MSLSIHSLTVRYGSNKILNETTLEAVPKGSLTVLLGPNGAGKSTVFKAIAGLIKSEYQQLKLNDVCLSTLSARDRMQNICYMPQTFSSSAMLSVFEVVLLARKTKMNWSVDSADLDAVATVLKRMGIQELAQRPLAELSGGQQQLVSFCQALVRKPQLYLLDEPTSALDLHRQLQLLEVLKEEIQRRERVCMIILHDLNLAAKFADHLVVMENGRVVTQGDVASVFESDALEKVYKVNLELVRSQSGHYVVAANSSIDPFTPNTKPTTALYD